jgi:lipoprotein NlpI
MGDYDQAIQDYDEAIQLNPRYVGALINRGRAQLYLGQLTAAQPDFATAVELEPSNAYSVLWLYLARSRYLGPWLYGTQSRAGQDALSELKKNSERLKLTTWPGPLIKLYLGEAPPEAILSAADNSDANKDREQHCETYFYLGERALIEGEGAEADRLFRQTIATGATSLVEYTGAQAELKRLQEETASAERK